MDPLKKDLACMGIIWDHMDVGSYGIMWDQMKLGSYELMWDHHGCKWSSSGVLLPRTTSDGSGDDSLV